MKRFRNILLVADGKAYGETALKRAVAVAKNNKARLTVVKVVDRLSNDLQMLKKTVRGEDIQKLIIQEHLKQLNDFIAPIKDEDIHVNIKVLTGTPFLEITKEVLRNKHDLVVTSAEGGRGLKGMLFGATAMHLMRKCPSPVWVIKPGEKTRFSRILAAVDPSHSDSDGKALNKKILELADSLAGSDGSELHVIHTWELYSEVILRSKSRLSDREVDRVVLETGKEHRNLLEKLLDEHNLEIPRKRVHFLRGDAGELIPGIAKQKRIDLIVMGSVGRTGINGLLIGNTAEEILQKVDCSVLTVKPDSYVSPIKID